MSGRRPYRRGRASFKRQIILVFVFGFLVLAGTFVAIMARNESRSLYAESDRAALGLARSLAVSSRSWVLASDLAGLQEVVQSFRSYPELRHAMVLSTQGQVLAHSDPARVGQQLVDAASRAALQSRLHESVLVDDADRIDAMVAVRVEGRVVGWARIALGRDSIRAKMREVTLQSLVFVIGCTLLAWGAALLIARRLGGRIGVLVAVAEHVRAGDDAVRATLPGAEDEISRLAESFNRMLERLAQHQQELRTASLYSRSLIEASLDPLMTIDGEGRIGDLNLAAERLCGQARDQLVGREFASLFTEPERAREFCTHAWLQEAVTDFPLVVRRADGSLADLLYNAGHFRDELGQMRGVLASARDVTERKQAEATRAQLAAIVEHSNDAIIGKTPEGVITHWNRAAERMYGYRAEEIVGQPVTRLLPPAQHAELQQLLAEVRGGAAVLNHETRRICKDGRVIDVALSMSPIRGAEGAICGISAIARDISERKRADEELRRYRDHLEEEVQQRTADLVLARNAAETANQAKSAFLANMSHELRTPLNAILGFSSLLCRDPQLPPEQRRTLDIINRSGEHLLALINDVLDMAKIESGRMQLEQAPLDLSALVRDVVEMMQVRAAERGLRLLLDPAPDCPRYVLGDESKLRQVLINLLSNAVKFTREGGVTVRLGCRPGPPRSLLIEVEDSGPGIARDDQERIFEPFVQLGEQGLNRGTGLGLPITRQFVQLMGGRIGLDSEPGRGSLFRVELPLVEVEANALPQAPTLRDEEVIGIAPGQQEFRILVAEDQYDNQLLMARLLEAAGFPYKLAENGAQAVQLVQQWQPQLVLMDRRMPVMDGIEATRRIRALPVGADIKIVAVTASAFHDQRQQLLDAGMDDFIRKPFRPGELYDCLARQLGVRFLLQPTPRAAVVVERVDTERLRALPSELRTRLAAALGSLDCESIAAVLAEIGPLDAGLQQGLQALEDNFDYAAVLAALEVTAHG